MYNLKVIIGSALYKSIFLYRYLEGAFCFDDAVNGKLVIVIPDGLAYCQPIAHLWGS